MLKNGLFRAFFGLFKEFHSMSGQRKLFLPGFSACKHLAHPRAGF